MRNLGRIIALVGISLISLFAAKPVLAFPPLPCSFYGTVKVNGVNIPDGTLIKVMINGQGYSEEQTQTYQGDSVYAMDISGDNPDTVVIEGGQDGDTIMFTIGGIIADQTGTWRSGSNNNLNLSASTTETLIAPQDTQTPMPTQTALIIVNQSSPNPTTKAQSTSTTDVLTQGSPQSTELRQFTPTIQAVTNPEKNTDNSSKTIVVIGIVLGVFILLTIIWLIYVRNPKVSESPDQKEVKK